MINNKKILSVILARKGSKGAKNKNFRKLLGRPLFQWSVLASFYSKYVDITAVSSNCNDVYKYFIDLRDELREKYNIKEVDEKLKWIQRPDAISGALSINEEALIHACTVSNMHFNLDSDVVVTLQPTSPCRLGGLLDLCIEEYDKGEYDSLITTFPDTPFIWQKINGKWKFTVDKNGCCNRKMRKEFEESELTHHDCGNIYISNKKILLETKCRIGEKPCIYDVDKLSALQIDSEEDFELIENILKTRKLETPI